MDNLSKEMMPGKPVSKKMRDLLDKEKNEARKRIIDRGIVHFRADNEFMAALLEAAEQLKIPPGTLCRRIVWEHLQSIHSASSSHTAETEFHVSDAVIEKLEAIQKLLARSAHDRPSVSNSNLPQDVATLVSELKSRQDEIRGELREIHACLIGPAEKHKRRSV